MEENLKSFPLPLANTKSPRKKFQSCFEKSYLCMIAILQSMFSLLPIPCLFYGKMKEVLLFFEARTWKSERITRV